MKLKKIIIVLLTIIMSLTLMIGCKPQEKLPTPVPPAPESKIPTVPTAKYGERIEKPQNHLFEDFEFGAGGFTESLFYINHNKWGYNNNGVKGENVSYTDDGIAILKAYGDYAQDEKLKRSGSCLLSQEFMGPGLIEVAMKIMPRLGGCTAIWPFYEGTNEETGEYLYQEIDIEYPAGNEHVNGVLRPATYEKVMNTNYADSWKEQGGGPVRSTKTETFTPANDGAWHKYSMLWESEPTPRIRYYVDGVLTSDTNDDPNGYKTVSIATAPLQIGVWFPNGWAGDRNFDEASALVDWVSYMPFYDQESIPSKMPNTDALSGVYPHSLYPKKPVALPETNYISNAKFENTTDVDLEGKKSLAWNGDYATANNGSNGKALSLSNGKSVSQTITAVYGKNRTQNDKFDGVSYFYEYDLTGEFFASLNGTAAVKVEFLNEQGGVISSGTKTHAISDSGKFELNVKSVDGCKAMRVTLSCTSGSGMFDNLNMKLNKISN